MARDLDVNRLRVLMEVAHARSIAEAARNLAFTPSALSQQISKLETEIGARLLERHPNGITLTPVGAVLVEHAEQVIGALRLARAAVDAAMGTQPQRLALGSFASAAQLLVPAAMAALQAHHPRAELSLVQIEPPDGYALVTSGDLDALVTHRYPGMPATAHPGLDRQILLDDPLRLAVPAGHRLAAGPAQRGVELARLTHETWIAGAPGIPNRTCLETLARQAGIEAPVAYESADYHVILALVGAGLGIALVPDSVLAAADRSRVTARTLHGPTPARRISIVHRRRPTALVREMTDYLREAAGAARPATAGSSQEPGGGVQEPGGGERGPL